ncbi:MAG: MFS transporter [Oscillospiraceae bacterium]|nr:MFS transporter [Oscillospiraceae bacterium]
MSEKQDNALRPFGMRDKIGYAMGDFGCNMSFSFISNNIITFFAICMKMDPLLCGFLIFIGKVFDAINDPIIGGLVDSSKPGKDGKFKTWIKWASIPLLVCSVLMFIYVPNAPMGVKIAMCLGLYCLWSVAYTSVNVPYGSMQSVITKEPSERAQLSTWRSIGAMLAQAPIMVIIPLIIFDENDNPIGSRFIYCVAVMGVLGLIGFYLCRKMTTERIQPEAVQPEKFNYLNTIKSFFKNKNILAVTIASFAQLAFIMSVTNTMQYVFMCYFSNTKLISIAAVIAGVPVAIGVVLLRPAIKRFSKKQLCTYPFILSIIGAAVAAFVKISNPYVWMIFIGLTMMGTSFFTVLMWALVADCIDYQEQQSGRREESSIYATYSFFRKVAQGACSLIVTFVLKISAYNVKLDASSQAAGVPEKLYTLTGLMPLIGAVIAFVSMYFLYKLNDNAMEETR